MRPTSHDYTVRVHFDAPMEFVFQWCTDYSQEDPALEGEDYERSILSKDRREVLYEDLAKSPAGGWLWSRWRVALHAPNRWDGRAIGSTRDWTIRYRLRSLSPTRTELTLQGRRRSARLSGPGASPAVVQANLEANWRSLKKALESDFRRSRSAGRRKPSRPSSRNRRTR